MKEPTMLYKHPGQHHLHNSTFDYVIVDAAEVNEYKNAGWYETTNEAIASACAVPEKAEGTNLATGDVSDIPKDAVQVAPEAKRRGRPAKSGA